MTALGWRHTPPPLLAAPVHEGRLATPADLTLQRAELHRKVLRDLPESATEDDVERLLLAFEELASNGLRHGRRPVLVVVAQDDGGWLVDVTDAAVDVPPAPAVDRDPAQGGLGLYLVARLSAACGWWTHGERKHVWARVQAAASA